MEEFKEYLEANLSPIQADMVIDEVIAELEELTLNVIALELKSDNVSSEVVRILNDKLTLKGINNEIRSNIVARVTMIVLNLYKTIS